MSRSDACLTSTINAEKQARAALLKMTRQKWLLVRLFGHLLRLLLPFLPPPRSPRGSNQNPSSLMVIEYWNLGDLAIVTPFLRQLRQRFPGASISLLVNNALANFLEGQGLVDEFIPVRVPWAQHLSRWKKYNPFSKLWLPFFGVLWRLRKKDVDIVFSGRMDIRDNLLMWLTGASRRIGYGVGGGGFLLTDRVVPDSSRPHRSDVWLRLLSAVGVAAEVDETEIFGLKAGEEVAAQNYLDLHRIPSGAFLVGIHPGARIPLRRWGNERFAAVAEELLRDEDSHVLWFVEPGSPATPPNHERCHVAAVEFRQFLALLARCGLLVCNDSGPMHLANLLKVPVVAVFGPQKPDWFGPRGPNDRVVIRPEMWCRPCFDYCIFDQPYCLKLIRPESVIKAACEVRLERQPDAVAQVKL